MGCGKSSIGRALSRKTNSIYMDTDSVIEFTENQKVSDIFSKYGEAHFRSIEKKTIEDINPHKFTIVSTGGGVICNSETVDLMKKKGTVIYLHLDLPLLIGRLKHDKKRPLLQKGNRIETIKNLYAKRENMYENAKNFKVETSHKSIPQVLSELMKIIEIIK
jgi:shikimate kinase